MKRCLCTLLALLMIVSSIPSVYAKDAYDENGRYVYRESTYDYPMLKDPMHISDENFYGKWNSDTNTWEIESLFDYEKFPGLADVEAAVKDGDYDKAKQALMDYYVPQKYNKTGQTASISENAVIEANMEAKNVYANSLQNSVPRSIITIPSSTSSNPADWQDISVDITASINHAVTGGQMYNTLVLMSMDKSNTFCEMMSRESSTPPTVRVVVNGVSKELPIYADAEIRAANYANRNYGSEEVMHIQENGYWCHWDNFNRPWTYEASDTRRVYLNIDITSLNKSDTISVAELNFKARTVAEYENGVNKYDLDKKELLVLEWQDTSWEENKITWNSFSDWLAFSANDLDAWDFVTSATTTKKGKMGAYYHRGNSQSMVASLYDYTGVEEYAYTFVRQGMSLINYVGVTNSIMNALDMSGYVRRIGNSFIKCWGSEALTADAFTAYMKQFYEMVEFIISKYILTHKYDNNWASYATLAAYHMAAIYPEFKRADYWFDVAVEDNKRLTSGFALPDGSPIELGQGYLRTLLGTLSSPLVIYETTNTPYGMPYDQDGIDQAYKLVKTLYHQMAPGYRGFNMGDSMDANLTTEVTSVLSDWYRYFKQFGIDDEELKYVVTEGKDGKLPDFTSISYPNGLRTYMRSDWGEDALALAFTAKGDGSHGHHDNLSLAMWAYGQFLLTDQSYGSTLTGDIVNYMPMAKNHNLVTVNDGDNAVGKDGVEKEQEIDDLYNFTTYSTIYLDDAKLSQRSVMFLKNQKFWIVSDYLEPTDSTKVNTYKQFWHMLPQAGMTLSDKNEFRSNFVGDANIIVSAVDTDSMSGIYFDDSIYSPTDGAFINTKKGVYERKVYGNTAYGTILFPLQQGQDVSIDSQEIDTGKPNKSGYAINFRVTDNSDESYKNYYYYHLNDLSQAKDVTVGKYSTDATTMLVEEDETGKVLSIFLYDATYLTSSTVKDSYIFKSINGEKTMGIDFSAGDLLSISSAETDSDMLDGTAYYSGFNTTKAVFNGSILSNAKKDNVYLYFGDTSPVSGTEEPTQPDNPSSGGGIHNGGGGGGGSVAPKPGNDDKPDKPDTPDTPDNPSVDKNPFSDVDEKSWSYKYIKGLYDEGIISGDGDGNFNPGSSVKREEFLKMLMGALKIDVDSDAENTFSDVDANAWYAPYVLTSKKLGIVNGISDDKFGIAANISRQDMSVMIARILSSMDVSADKDEESFADNDEIADYAADAVYMMKKLGIIKGYENKFNPRGDLTREEAASVIYSLIEYVNNLKTEAE